jgi:phage shock protein A
MANGFVKAWRYVSAWFGAKVDEKADPRIQIQQSIEEAQKQHQALTRQAASVIGNQHQLELKLDRQLGEIEQYQAEARQALVLADKARASGDEAKAAEFEQTAGMIANKLVSAEQSATDLKQLHDQSIGAAQQARQAVSDSEARLQQSLAERTKLLSQLEQAKMQEQVSASLSQMSELAAPTNTPSLEEVREKIERRYATALGESELASTSTQGRIMEVRKATLDMAAQSKLDEIRASMKSPTTAGPGAPAVGSDQHPAIDPADAATPNSSPAETTAAEQQNPG